MIDQSDAHSPAKPGTEARTERFLVLALLGLVLIVVLGVYLTISVQTLRSKFPDRT